MESCPGVRRVQNKSHTVTLVEKKFHMAPNGPLQGAILGLFQGRVVYKVLLTPHFGHKTV